MIACLATKSLRRLLVVACLLGWASGWAGDREPAPVVIPPPRPAPVVASGTFAQAFPTGRPETSQLLLESQAPARVVPGGVYERIITLTNLTDCALARVTLQELLPPEVKMVASEPAVTRGQGAELTWELGTLAPRASTVIRARLSADREGRFTQCLLPAWRPAACVEVAVVAPFLALGLRHPAQGGTCDPIPVELLLRNTGGAPLDEVAALLPLPEGLRGAGGETELRVAVPKLAPGESRVATVALRADRAGRFVLRGQATAAGGMVAEAQGEIQVRQARLTVALEAPREQFLDRPATHRLTVTNEGDDDARLATLTLHLPPQTPVRSASDGGVAGAEAVRWDLGTLAPGQTRTVTAVLQPARIGEGGPRASATATCAAQANMAALTQVRGVPALGIEVVDLQDPIEVGREGIYVITVINQGTAHDHEIALTCHFEAEQSFLDATGPSEGRHDPTARKVTFAPVADLPPGRTLEWRVRFRADKPGDVRFRAQLNTRELQRPVFETEATKQY